MKILVCISKTPDTTAKIAFTDNNTKFAEAGVQWIINPYDEWYALVRAIELKEKDPSTVIHLVTVGGADADPVIRKALALGGDEAVRINTTPSEPLLWLRKLPRWRGAAVTTLFSPAKKRSITTTDPLAACLPNCWTGRM
jgi:electron transfer flavoprotein alpha/beta subunit